MAGLCIVALNNKTLNDGGVVHNTSRKRPHFQQQLSASLNL